MRRDDSHAAASLRGAADNTNRVHGFWRKEGHPLEIEYRLAVLAEVAGFAKDGLERLARGGVEVGGVLFGTRRGSRIEISAWRPAACEHAFGPAFRLSAKDEELLDRFLANAPDDPELRDLEAVGWFHSVTRGPLGLREEDIEMPSRRFAAPWQVVFLLKPEKRGAARASFFLREADGNLDGSPQRPFPISPQPPETARLRAVPPAPRLQGTASAVKVRRGVQPWIAAAFCILLAAASGGFIYWRIVVPPPAVIGLQVLDTDRVFLVAWDQHSPLFDGATGADLDITDGEVQVRRKLSAAELRQGSFRHARSSGDVQVRFRLYHPAREAVEEYRRFLGPAPLAATDVGPETAQKIATLEKEVERLQSELRQERRKARELQDLLNALQVTAPRPEAKPK